MGATFARVQSAATSKVAEQTEVDTWITRLEQTDSSRTDRSGNSSRSGLDPIGLCQACSHVNHNGERRVPTWRSPPGGQTYQPSYNMTPGSYVPTLLSSRHFSEPNTEQPNKLDDGNESSKDWVIQPMLWGLVPSWSKDRSGSYKMNNARSDGLLDKASYKTPLRKGRRCVLLVEGYYEWQTRDGKKQPYLLYAPTATTDVLKAVNKNDLISGREEVWSGRKLLTMAGIFDIWQPKVKDECEIYSCSIITTDAHPTISWIHHRMPAILSGEHEVQQWLDYGEVPLDKALQLIRPTDSVQCHAVSSSYVNNSKVKSVDCIQPVDLHMKPKQSVSNKLMSSWLNNGRKRESSEGGNVVGKKIKQEK